MYPVSGLHEPNNSYDVLIDMLTEDWYERSIIPTKRERQRGFIILSSHGTGLTLENGH